MMREQDHLRTPNDRKRGGQGGEETFASEEGTRADLEKPVTGSERTSAETLSDVGSGGGHISGPGPNDLTRGLP
jgi:hypothetical protein